LEYFTVIWYILRPFGNVVVIGHNFSRFGLLCHEKSGNPGLDRVYLPAEILIVFTAAVISEF
jgi:hypothetical protein